MKITWTKTPLTSKETYAKEKYVCELYDSKCELCLWNDNTWRVIDNIFECRLEAEALEEATKETVEWFLKRIERRIEERKEDIGKIKEKLKKNVLIREEIKNAEIIIEK